MEHEDVTITSNFGITPDDVVGKLTALSPEGKAIINLMKQGYVFSVAPQIKHDGVDKDGNYINPELLGVSILTYTAKKEVTP